MKKILLILALIISAENLSACYCHNRQTLDSLTQLNQYDFIAHVFVTNVTIHAEKNTSLQDSEYDVQIIEHFKGPLMSKVFQYKTNAIGCWRLDAGEEAILFGRNKNGIIYIESCDFNETYRHKGGLRSWLAYFSESALGKLKKWYHKDRVDSFSGMAKAYYRNGKIETQEQYINGQLSGEKLVWYPSGKLYLKQNYLHGSLHGKTEVFRETGQLIEDYFYNKGILVNVARTYHDTAYWNSASLAPYPFHQKFSPPTSPRRIQVSTEFFYDEQGRLCSTRSFSKDGNLIGESFRDLHRDIIVSFDYHANGNFAAIVLRPKYLNAFSAYFDENGSIINVIK